MYRSIWWLESRCIPNYLMCYPFDSCQLYESSRADFRECKLFPRSMSLSFTLLGSFSGYLEHICCLSTLLLSERGQVLVSSLGDDGWSTMMEESKLNVPSLPASPWGEKGKEIVILWLNAPQEDSPPFLAKGYFWETDSNCKILGPWIKLLLNTTIQNLASFYFKLWAT